MSAKRDAGHLSQGDRNNATNESPLKTVSELFCSARNMVDAFNKPSEPNV